jgi:hypothetical protein
MNNYYEIEKFEKLKNVQFEDEGARERQARQACAGQSGSGKQIASKIGKALIALGEGLKALVGNERTLNV